MHLHQSGSISTAVKLIQGNRVGPSCPHCHAVHLEPHGDVAAAAHVAQALGVTVIVCHESERPKTNVP